MGLFAAVNISGYVAKLCLGKVTKEFEFAARRLETVMNRAVWVEGGGNFTALPCTVHPHPRDLSTRIIDETDTEVGSDRQSLTVVNFSFAQFTRHVIVCCLVTNSPSHVNRLPQETQTTLAVKGQLTVIYL